MRRNCPRVQTALLPKNRPAPPGTNRPGTPRARTQSNQSSPALPLRLRPPEDALPAVIRGPRRAPPCILQVRRGQRTDCGPGRRLQLIDIATEQHAHAPEWP
eukprot:552041-Pyramimonas_sp.AAC.1